MSWFIVILYSNLVCSMEVVMNKGYGNEFVFDII